MIYIRMIDLCNEKNILIQDLLELPLGKCVKVQHCSTINLSEINWCGGVS